MKYSYQYLLDQLTKGYRNFIKNNHNKNLDWNDLSSNSHIIWEFIETNPDKIVIGAIYLYTIEFLKCRGFTNKKINKCCLFQDV